MKNFLNILFINLIAHSLYAQYPPPAGQEGTTAIHKDSSVFIAWAVDCELENGFINIATPDSGYVVFGEPQNAAGPSDNLIVSLGDGGFTTLTFEIPLANGQGPDFAIFENSFLDDFLELAFVEVSSNGSDFFRFEAVSLTQTETQVGPFGNLDATKIYNLAGKYRATYGTPFDLEEMKDIPQLNVNHITHVRIRDVVGSISDEFASLDSEGAKVNDPWPTPFPSGGFDLEAVGIIHNTSNASIREDLSTSLKIYPNPAKDFLFLESMSELDYQELEIYDELGVRMKTISKLSSPYQQAIEIDISNFPSGLYMIRVISNRNSFSQKFLKK